MTTKRPALTPLRLLVLLTGWLIWLATTALILGVVAPEMVSEPNSVSVAIGFAFAVLWLIASACLGLLLFQQRRIDGATNEETPQ
jgi:hypothetical protein